MKAPNLTAVLLTGVACAAATMSGITPAQADVKPNIIGGGEADQGYSFITSVQIKGEHACGGALITPEFVLTAAQCVAGDDVFPDDVSVRIGSKDRTVGGEEHKAVALTMRVDYPQDPGADIALIKLDAPATAAPIKLATANDVGTKSQILGWGKTAADPNAELPTMLHRLDTEIVPMEQCTTPTKDPDRELCTGTPTPEAGACDGDWGGPQIVGTEGDLAVLGVASRAGNDDGACGTGPVLYTDVVHHTDWINAFTR